MYVENEADVTGIVLEPPPNLGKVVTILVGLTAAVVALAMLLSSWQPSPHDTKPKQVDPLAEYRSQIAALKARQDEAHRLLGVLRRDREALTDRLKRPGIRSSADLKNIPAARPLVEELVEVIHQIRAQEQKVQWIGVAVVEAESRLRRIERQATVKATSLGEAEQERVVRASVELSEALRSDLSDLIVLDEGLDMFLVEPPVNQ